MWLKETKPECCVEHEPLPADIQCLTPDICRELGRLYYKHCKTFVRNQRIIELAKSKSRKRVHRVINRCPCYLKKSIEIIRLDQRANTRTEQLAFPRARHLLLFKEQILRLFSSERILNLNRLIRKSLFSLYSRLANVQPPQERKPIKKWDSSDWEKHTKILKKLAKPKVAPKPPAMPVKRMPLRQMKRYKYLAKPKKSQYVEKADWVFTYEMRTHKASERTKNLAKPLIRDTTMLYQDLPIKIPLGVLKHKASKRIIELAEPNARRTGQAAPSDLKENPFGISPNALKTKASKRTQELAEPKEYENKHIRDDPYAISKAALNAKAKPRTIELAQPKKL
ncbi:uncharacterized protein LOC119605605 [Lucilia sericata]|uniref:uncharacterized protein LOC119605605 n=1 Tax=Lucilia sericata TaxID=13632 RepID=UPI0018A84F98|nr:uncharacterized protein LOC119605605 [Lucilia sericata]